MGEGRSVAIGALDAVGGGTELLCSPGGRGTRLVITGYRDLAPWALLADLDRATGALKLDTTFKARGAAQPGVYFGRDEWPHGRTGPAVPHGAVFARP